MCVAEMPLALLGALLPAPEKTPPGRPTELLTTLRRKDGTEHGAYFAAVRWLGD